MTDDQIRAIELRAEKLGPDAVTVDEIRALCDAAKMTAGSPVAWAVVGHGPTPILTDIDGTSLTEGMARLMARSARGYMIAPVYIGQAVEVDDEDGAAVSP